MAAEDNDNDNNMDMDNNLPLPLPLAVNRVVPCLPLEQQLARNPFRDITDLVVGPGHIPGRRCGHLEARRGRAPGQIGVKSLLIQVRARLRARARGRGAEHGLVRRRLDFSVSDVVEDKEKDKEKEKEKEETKEEKEEEEDPPAPMSTPTSTTTTNHKNKQKKKTKQRSRWNVDCGGHLDFCLACPKLCSTCEQKEKQEQRSQTVKLQQLHQQQQQQQKKQQQQQQQQPPIEVGCKTNPREKMYLERLAAKEAAIGRQFKNALKKPVSAAATAAAAAAAAAEMTTTKTKTKKTKGEEEKEVVVVEGTTTTTTTTSSCPSELRRQWKRTRALRLKVAVNSLAADFAAAAKAAKIAALVVESAHAGASALLLEIEENCW
jgi:hypothetical protein